MALAEPSTLFFIGGGGGGGLLPRDGGGGGACFLLSGMPGSRLVQLTFLDGTLSCEVAGEADRWDRPSYDGSGLLPSWNVESSEASID